MTSQEGWLKVDVTYVVKNWLDFLDSPVHAVNVVCKTCGMDKTESPVSFTSELKPFLVIYTHTQQRRTITHRRQRRSANCDSGITECCRESLYISFADIGWDDWIIKPEGYNAYFCKGSCTTAAAMTLSATQHNSILQVAVLVLLVNTLRVTTAKVPSVFGVFFSNSKNEEQDNSVEKVETTDYSVIKGEFTKLRIEYIKNQILKKLRLKEKPTITISELPKPVKEYESLLPSQDMGLQSSYSDDFYGKTTQAIVFPYEDEVRCSRTIRFPSACLPFQMPNDIHTSEVAVAELWFHKEKDFLDEHNQTFVIYEVAHWDTKRSFQKTTPIAITETSLTEGWLKVDVTYVVKNWLDFLDSPVHAVNVVCKTCGMDKTESPVSFTSELKPFLVIYTHTQQRRTITHRRQRRSANCDSGITECCRESLYISFADIGWDDWIIKPEGYNAYFCKGSCTTAAAMTLSATQHNSILQKVMNGHKKRRIAGPEITPCCAAIQFQPLQLVYMHSNKTLTTKLLSNMIVDSCGCM